MYLFNKIKILLSALLFILPTIQAAPRFSAYEASIFSLVVYDDWQQPSKPLPTGWDYLIRLPVNLQTNGYYGESFIGCDTYSCSVAIAHRGTTSVWDSYQIFQIMAGQEPYLYYMNALGYVDLVKKYADDVYWKKKQLRVIYYQTGHSLGAVLSELVAASGLTSVDYMDTNFVFDSPGTKTIIQNMMDQKQLPSNALYMAEKTSSHFLSGINAINTWNEQVSSKFDFDIEFEHEDFSNIPLSTIGSPGEIYYFTHYSLNQHKMINFYNAFWPQIHNIENNGISSKIKYIHDWPIGFSEGYKRYASYNYHHNYWDNYMRYMWDHNPSLHTTYKDDISEFQRDFIKHLDSGKNINAVTPKNIPSNQDRLEIDNEILKHQKSITPITDKKRPTLYDVINNNYDSSSNIRRQIYAALNNDTKLYLAVMCGDTKFAERLIQLTNANTNTQHGEGHYSLLQIAIMFGYLDMVQLLLQHHANPELKDNLGNTALHTIAHERCEDAPDYAKVLIAAGANPKVQNNTGDTPLIEMQKHCPEYAKEFFKILNPVKHL